MGPQYILGALNAENYLPSSTVPRDELVREIRQFGRGHSKREQHVFSFSDIRKSARPHNLGERVTTAEMGYKVFFSQDREISGLTCSICTARIHGGKVQQVISLL